jgi:septal ring factor EnvC (AmiA/AmiB activator)
MTAPSLPDTRCLALVPVLIGLLAIPAGSANIQPSPDLSVIEQQLDASQSRQAEIASEIESISREEAALVQKSVEVAKTIQSREAAILAAEDRLRNIEGEALRLRFDLAGRRASIARLLAGLQLIERNPPPALVVEPHDVLAALRGAMMFGTIVPQLKAEAAKLSRELARLDELRTRTADEQARLKDNLGRLTQARMELVELETRKKTLLAATGARLHAEKARAEELASKAKDLKQLLASLEVERLKQEAEAEARARAKADEEAKVAAAKLKADAKAEEDAEARAEAEASARREAERTRQPRVAFAATRGRLQYPAQGKIIKTYGSNDGFGGKTRGVFVATRAEAQIVSPADGHIEFAGPFRSYGQLLILNAGGGYHVLLAGLGEITAEQGQFVRAGEPVGTMGTRAAPGTATSNQVQGGKPVLYIEFRKDGEAIDSSPWWIGGFAQARG